MNDKILIEVSARHIHLSQKDLEVLFGDGYELNENKKLSQTGEFAAEEKLIIVGPRGKLEGVRIIGPVRNNSQVEISKTDGYKLGIIPPVRVSGDIEGTPEVKIIGPSGEAELEKGLILAQRHIHMSEDDANKYNVQDQQDVSIKVEGDRGLIFNKVIVRVKENFNLSFQIDTDEANAGLINNGDLGELIK